MVSKSITGAITRMPAPSIPDRAKGTHFYEYSRMEHPEWLRDIILRHEIYVPSLSELDDPTDGRPRVAGLPEEDIAEFLHKSYIDNHPWLTPAQSEHEKPVIRYNIRHHGLEMIMREIVKALNAELED